MYFSQNKILLSEDDHGNLIEDKNKIEFEGKLYYLKYINEEIKSSKGGNSSVFIIYDKEDGEERIIKISNSAKPKRGASSKKIRRHGRFINEINALYKIKEDKYLAGYIIDIKYDGEIDLGENIFPYYVMEKADTDLKDYMLLNDNLDVQEKFRLCFDVLMAIKKLHYQGYYHRDIKPDNVFLFIKKDEDGVVSFSWKIGDLGLIGERDKDYDDFGERIGPFGWISPEAMNKYLTEKYIIGHDCIIDDKSDVFQLGELFWFVFNKNVPIGIISENDFICNNLDFYELILVMLNYSKKNRFSLGDVEDILIPICHENGVI